MSGMITSLKKYILFLLGIGILVYVPSFTNQLFWDDEQFIYNNQYVQTFDIPKIFSTNTTAGAGEVSNYYRPLTTLSFAFDYQFWGVNPIGYHLTNTLLHTFAGVVLFLFLLSLGMAKKPAVTIASIFLLHPLQTEAVVYANSRGDSYYTLLLLLGLLSFSHLVQKKYLTATFYNLRFTFSKTYLRALTLVFFCTSILAKEIAVGSVLLYLLTFLFFLVQKKTTQIKTGSVTLLSLIVSFFGYFALRSSLLQFQENTNFFAGSPYGDSVLVRIATFSKVALIYLRLIVAPFNLHMERTTEIVTTLASPFTAALVFLIGITLFLGSIEWKQKNSTWIWFGIVWFFSMLGPVSGIIPINDIMYEHWLYVPMIGFFISLYGCLSLLFWKLKNPWPQVTNYPVGTLLIFYSVLTIRQNYLWATPIRFYSYILTFQETARIRNNLAMAHAEEGNLIEAIDNYQKSIALSDIYPQTHYNLARSYIALGENEKSLTELETAISMQPKFFIAYPLIIEVLLEQKQFDAASKYLGIFKEEYPNHSLTEQLTLLLEKTKTLDTTE